MPKCGFYVLKWEFDSNEKLILKESKSIISFTSQGIRIDSTRLQTKEVLTYLGVTSKPNGDQSAQAQVLIKKAEQIDQQLSSIQLSQYYAYTYLQYAINPKLTYTLATLSLSDIQLASIQGRVHPEVLTNTGFNRNFPIELRYGKKYSSVGLLDLKPEQRITNIQMIHKLLLHSVHKKT